MNELYQQILEEGLEQHKAMNFKDAEINYNRVLNQMPFDEGTTFLLADLYMRKEFNGLSINLLCNLLQNNPKHGAAWCNLGCAFRKENQYDRAAQAWKRAIGVDGETVEVCNNLSSLYADRAQPDKALEWLDKALKIEPQNERAHWGRALALLTQRKWKEGWEEYEWRQKLETWDSRKSVVAPIWDGSLVNHLYVHGEQGVGDEVMFASALPMVAALAKHVTVEVNAKVAKLIEQSFPAFDVVSIETPGDYDAKIPIGSLIRMFGFNPKIYLHPDPRLVKKYIRKLERLGKRPYIALTWMGGAKATRVEDRSIRLQEMLPIINNYTCVSAQHWSDNDLVKKEINDAMLDCKLPQINEESRGQDLHEQAALFKAVDCVVTVQQTAVHVAGAVGAKTHCIIGSMPHWRYGLEGDSLPFYRSVKLHRRTSDWKEVIGRVCADLRSL